MTGNWENAGFDARFSALPPQGAKSACHEREFRATKSPSHRTNGRFMHQGFVIRGERAK
jgi:hypothetical protein